MGVRGEVLMMDMFLFSWEMVLVGRDEGQEVVFVNTNLFSLSNDLTPFSLW